MNQAVPDHPARPSLTPGRVVLLVGLLAIAAGILARSVAAWLAPAPTPPDLAEAARDYLHGQEIEPLTGPLAKLLADAKSTRVRSQLYTFLNKPAPDFQLKDSRGRTWKLSRQRQDGPVVLVFYYGYHCNHCVSQLFQLNDDLHYFKELGAQVIAVSADPAELTRERLQQYGEFGFPVLSDPNFRVARMYEVFKPPMGTQEAVLLHGTFIIDRNGVVQWAARDYQPFESNATLLYKLAELEGKLPSN
jgi:peroxiredoxin